MKAHRLAALLGAAAILLAGFALRLAPWGYNRFLEDEALYTYWGLRIVTGADSLLDQEPVDKPPLYPYALACSILLFSSFEPLEGAQSPAEAPSPIGIHLARGSAAHSLTRQLESAVRLPSLFASTASIAILYALARQLSGDARVGLLAALLLALSPFDILFASTAFTDPLMTALGMGALLAAAGARMGAAGLLAGLAMITKQQGLLFLPLVAALGLGLRPPRAQGRRLARFALGLAVPVAFAAAWDLARTQSPGFIAQSLLSYGGLSLAPLSELADRGAAWAQTLGYVWASPWFYALLLAAAAACLFVAVRSGAVWPCFARMPGRVWADPAGTPTPLGLQRAAPLFALFVLAYLALHWLIAFQIWDRYVLGLVPLLSLLAAVAFLSPAGLISSRQGRHLYAAALAAFLAVALAAPAVKASRSEFPVGGDHGAYDGIDELAAHIRSIAPPGAVLYDYWLGYHYRFYLYGATLRIHWYPDVADLVHDSLVYQHETRYIAFPSWRDSSSALQALSEAGIQAVPIYETTRRNGTTSFRLYLLEGP